MLWFLPALFVINVLFNLIFNFTRSYRYIVLGLLFLIAVLMIGNKNNLLLPYHINSALLMIPFFTVGILLKENYKLILDKLRGVKFVVGVSLFLIGLGLAYFNIAIPDVRVNIIGNSLIFFVSASLSILGLLLLSQYIELKVLTWMGLNSLAIMCLHLKLKGGVLKFLSYVEFNDSLGLITVVLIVVLCVPFAFMFNKYFPFAVGLKIKNE